MLNRLKSDGRKNGAEYNGGVSSVQLKWLQQQLEAAKKESKRVIVFSHHPLYPDNGLSALNDHELLNLIGKYSTVVTAVISGHHHVGAFGTFQGIPLITTEGMVETKDENAYGLVEIYKDELILTGKGRTRSYRFTLK